MIHQAKSNPQLLDEQIFSERLAFAISAIGPKRTWRSGHEMSANRSKADIAEGRLDVGF
jgi:hypothetical protein